MKIKVFYISLLLLFLAFNVKGQETKKYTGDNSLYYHAEELFEKAQYSAARVEFRAFINAHQSENDLFVQKAYYYEGLSALELFNEDAIPLLIAYNNRYPENINKAVI